MGVFDQDSPAQAPSQSASDLKLTVSKAARPWWSDVALFFARATLYTITNGAAGAFLMLGLNEFGISASFYACSMITTALCIVLVSALAGTR